MNFSESDGKNNTFANFGLQMCCFVR